MTPARGRSPCSSCERGVEQRPGTCTPNPPRAARDLSRRRPSSRNPAIEKTPARVSRSFDRPRDHAPGEFNVAPRGIEPREPDRATRREAQLMPPSSPEIFARPRPKSGRDRCPAPGRVRHTRRVGRNSHPFPSRHPRQNNNRSTTLVFRPLVRRMTPTANEPTARTRHLPERHPRRARYPPPRPSSDRRPC